MSDTNPIPLGRALRPTLQIAAAWTAAALALKAGGALSPVPEALAWLAVPVCAVAAIALMTWCCHRFSHRQESAFGHYGWLRRVMLLGCLGLGAGLHLARSGGPDHGLLAIMASLNLLVFALLIGNAMVHSVRKASELVPVCVIMSVADLFSVFAGPSKLMAAAIGSYYRGGRVGPAPLSDLLLVKVPVPGFAYPVPIFGVADLIILAFLVAATRKFGLDDNLAGGACYLPAAAIGLTAAILFAQLFGLFLPALPLIALVFLTVTLPRHPAMRQLQQTEWLAVTLGGVLLLGMGVAGMI